MSERVRLAERLASSNMEYVRALDAREKAKAALKEFDAKPPFGTLLAGTDTGGDQVFAIRLRYSYHYKWTLQHADESGPGWQVIFSDGSGEFYPDSKGGLDGGDDRFENLTEVYHP